VADRDGKHLSTLLRRRTCIGDVGVSWSPRGGAVAFLTRFEDRAATVTVDLVAPDGSHERRLATFTSSRDTDQGPVWSPDGTRLAYSGESGDGSLDLTVVDLSGDRRQLTSGPDDDFDPRWSPHGDRILFMREIGPSVLVLFAVPARGGDVVRLPGRWVDVAAAWSPDGSFIALAGVPVGSDGRYRLYVLDLDAWRIRQLALEPDAVRPAWSPDGRRIAFATQDGRVATVAPSGGAVETLADLGDAVIGDLEWSPDGSGLVFRAAKPPPED
jgi:Tol biopolymer transport system component